MPFGPTALQFPTVQLFSCKLCNFSDFFCIFPCSGSRSVRLCSICTSYCCHFILDFPEDVLGFLNFAHLFRDLVLPRISYSPHLVLRPHLAPRTAPMPSFTHSPSARHFHATLAKLLPWRIELSMPTDDVPNHPTMAKLTNCVHLLWTRACKRFPCNQIGVSGLASSTHGS